jgi:hypothetical protein
MGHYNGKDAVVGSPFAIRCVPTGQRMIEGPPLLTIHGELWAIE